MANRLVSVDSATHQFPTDERATLAANLADGDTVEGASLASALTVSVRAFGAVGDGVADDTAAITAAVAHVQSTVGRGQVWFPAGTYLTTGVTIYGNIDYVGAGRNATRVKLKNASNTDLFVTDQFSTLTGGVALDGPSKWSIRDMRLDGNGANQTGTSYPLRVYGSAYRVENVDIINGKTGNVWSEWADGGVDMEAHWSNFTLGEPLAGPNMTWKGPHDSQFVNGIVYVSGTPASSFDGISIAGNAAGEQFSNVHVWGAHAVGWRIDEPIRAMNCVSEGATAQNLLLLANDITWIGEVFGTLGVNPTEIGVQIGDGSNSVTRCLVDVKTQRWASGSTPVVFSNDNANMIRVTGPAGTATNFYTGTPSVNSDLSLHCVDTPTKGVVQHQKPARQYSKLTVQIADSNAIAVGPNGATNPVLQVNSSVASQATGLALIGRAAAAGASVQVISSGTDEDLHLNAKGAGTAKVGASTNKLGFFGATGQVKQALAAAATDAATTQALVNQIRTLLINHGLVT